MEDLSARVIVSHGADEEGVSSETAQMPRHIEGRASQHAGTVGKVVEEHFPEDEDAPIQTQRGVARIRGLLLCR